MPGWLLVLAGCLVKPYGGLPWLLDALLASYAQVSAPNGEVQSLRERLDWKFAAASGLAVLVEPRVFYRLGGVLAVIPGCDS